MVWGSNVETLLTKRYTHRDYLVSLVQYSKTVEIYKIWLLVIRETKIYNKKRRGGRTKCKTNQTKLNQLILSLSSQYYIGMNLYDDCLM